MVVKGEKPDGGGRSRGGRPPQTAQQHEVARARILTATRAVFAEHGYYGVTVSRILKHLGMSRATFYRYFRNADEAVCTVIEAAGDASLVALHASVGEVEGSIAKVLAGIEAHLRWSSEQADIAQSLEAGIHDPQNPVSRMRERVHAEITELLVTEANATGRGNPDPLTLNVYITTMEHTSYHMRRTTSGDEAAENNARTIMIKCALALLGTPEDWKLLEADPATLGLAE
ncbi:TetR/AcrR family transcriptional regulator [Nocardia callitridis]|uniref:TetR family transcriptional regulator n=1 Tax=Nocardia callitridis TaxID=648753 RepID=A0ABP9KV35_9NOCA